MARDRLAAMRAQQGGGGASPYGSNTSAPTARQTRAQNPYDQRDQGLDQQGGEGGYEAGYGGGYDGQSNQGGYQQPSSGQQGGYVQQSQYDQGGYGQQQGYTEKPSYNNQQQSYSTPQRSNNAYEMGPVGNGDPNSVPSMSEFLDEISAISDEIGKYDANINQISRLHSSLLNNVESGNTNNQQLDNLIEDMRVASSAIANRIKGLQKRPMPAKSSGQRKQQLEFVNKKFRDSLQKYQAEEKLYRDKYKERMARQFRIVKPNATDEEVQQVVNSDQGVQIFAQATMSNRVAGSQTAYREVQARHEQIKQIERSIEQLAQLFHDMSLLVQQQDDAIIIIEETTGQVVNDTDKAEGHTQKARLSAIAYRKKRWICFILTLIILAIIGIVVGVEVAQHTNKSSNNNSQ